MDGSLKLGDFGLARKMEEGEKSKTFCGSTDYAAPELFVQGMVLIYMYYVPYYIYYMIHIDYMI